MGEGSERGSIAPSFTPQRGVGECALDLSAPPLFNPRKPGVARGAWFSEVCSGRRTQETAVSKGVKCKMRNTCV